MPKSGPDTGRIMSHTEFIVHIFSLTLWYFPFAFLLKWKTSSLRYQVPLDSSSGSTLRKSFVPFFSLGDRWHRRLKRTCLPHSVLAFLQWERKEPLRMGCRHWQWEGKGGGKWGNEFLHTTPWNLAKWVSQWKHMGSVGSGMGMDLNLQKEPSFLPWGSK